MTAARGTGFHPADADYTQGRGQALADAESLVRRQFGLARGVKLTPPADLAKGGGE